MQKYEKHQNPTFELRLFFVQNWKKNTPFKNGTTFVVNWLAQFKW